jgi:hypothetical protein
MGRAEGGGIARGRRADWRTATFVEVVVVAVEVLADAAHPEAAGFAVGLRILDLATEKGAAVEEAALIPEVVVVDLKRSIFPRTTQDRERGAALDGGGRVQLDVGRARIGVGAARQTGQGGQHDQLQKFPHWVAIGAPGEN